MSSQGQMLQTTERGKILSETIKKYKPKTIVEIGTWKGLGSTKCILESMCDDSYFISLETNESFYNIANENLKNYKNNFKLIYGTIVNESHLNKFISDKNLSSEQKNWFYDDIKDIKKCNNVLTDIPLTIELLLLDGGEFSTYHEWLILKDRTKIVCLDDTKELKTNQIYNELLNDNNYTLLSDTSDGNGFSVFVKN